MSRPKPKAPKAHSPAVQEHVDHVYLLTLDWQCNAFIRAIERVNESIDKYNAAKNDDTREQVFSDAQSAIMFAANIGKMLWPEKPKRKTRAIAKPRGVRMRSLTGITTDGKALQEADRATAGAALYRDEGAIFTDEIGHRLTPMAATNGFARLARRAGISTTRLHDARHTAATTMLWNGVDPTTAAAILGHSSPTVTLQVYSHVVPGLQQGAIDCLGERIELLAATDCNQIATNPMRVTKKARGYGLRLVAPTGIEPVFPP